MYQIHEVDGEINDQRVTKPLYRAAGSDHWEEKSLGRDPGHDSPQGEGHQGRQTC